MIVLLKSKRKNRFKTLIAAILANGDLLKSALQ